jgi:anti-sigma factor RsiW
MNHRMDDHVSPWIGAYIDGELIGALREQVEAHLTTCPACRAELAEMRALSSLLRRQPLPASPASDAAFAAAVVNRLPSVPSPWTRRAMQAAWQGAPLVLFLVWAFFQSVLTISGIVLIALQFIPGAQAAVANLLPFTAGALTSGTGLLEGLLHLDLLHSLTPGAVSSGISLVDWISPLFLVQLALLAVTAGLFLAWLASWWASRARQSSLIA